MFIDVLVKNLSLYGDKLFCPDLARRNPVWARTHARDTSSSRHACLVQQNMINQRTNNGSQCPS